MSKEHPLIRALWMNAVFSGVSALFLFAAASWLAAQLGLADATPVYVVSIAVLTFAVLQIRGLRAYRREA